jgi:ribosomal protein L37AE/L43A
MDEGSLVCYITDGSDVVFRGFEGRSEHLQYRHQIMINRWNLRLLQHKQTLTCPNCQKEVLLKHANGVKCAECNTAIHPPKYTQSIVLDRGYPNDMYTNCVLNKLLEICNDKDINLSIFQGYNSSQGCRNFVLKDFVSDEMTQHQITAYSSYKIQCSVLEDSEEHDCDCCDEMRRRLCNNCQPVCNGVCNNCDLREEYHCGDCDNFDPDYCNARSCDGCEYNPCETNCSDVEFSHYDDQNGGGDPYSRGEVTGSRYYYKYTIYYPINANRHHEVVEMYKIPESEIKK